jgi:glycine hydroxymethyltransferase
MKRGVELVTGGTDNHIVLMDVRSFGLTGRHAESALLDSGIVTNRNSIPRDPNGAWYTSGVRLGTPALTTRGLDENGMNRVAELIVDVLAATAPEAGPTGAPSKAKYRMADGVAGKTKASCAELLSGYPLYPEVDLG